MPDTTSKLLYITHLYFTVNYEVGMSFISILRMKKLKLREVE